MEKAKQEVDKLRVQLGRMQSQANLSRIKSLRGSGAAGQMVKSEAVIEAEKKLADSTRRFNELRIQLHHEYQYQEAMTLLSQRANLQKELNEENLLTALSATRLKQLTNALHSCERKLVEIERKLFQHEERFLNAKRELVTFENTLRNAKRSQRSGLSQKVNTGPDQNKLNLQQEIKAAIQVYSVAEKEYRDARTIARQKTYTAMRKYNDWRRGKGKKKGKNSRKKK